MTRHACPKAACGKSLGQESKLYIKKDHHVKGLLTVTMMLDVDTGCRNALDDTTDGLVAGR